MEPRLNAKQEQVVELENKLKQVKVREHHKFRSTGCKICSKQHVIAKVIIIIVIIYLTIYTDIDLQSDAIYNSIMSCNYKHTLYCTP